MNIELEAKFLDIDVEKIRTFLTEKGATLVHPERLMRRKNFDYPDKRLEKIGGWIRVRDEGDAVTLAYKQLEHRGLDGTKEISLIVENFDTISNLLCTIGLENKSFQETKRERWDLNGVEVTIDTWPWIPTFVELEGSHEEKLKEVAQQLGLDWNTAMHGSVETAYQAYYNVSDEEIYKLETITFTSPPEWFGARKK